MELAPSRPRGLAHAALLAGVLVMGSPSSALALNPALDISQYDHTAWKIRDGFSKGTIVAIAQTADGYLWLGTEFGLLRFDGVRYVEWQPPAGQPLPSSYIRGLLAARDGALWIGTSKGLVSWKGGNLTRYPQLEGQAVWALLEDRQGIVWAGGQATPAAKLCAIHHSSVVECHGEDGRFGQFIDALHEDRAGNIWVGGIAGLWRWKPGLPKLYPTPDRVRGLLPGDNGTLLMVSYSGIRQLVDGELVEYALPATDLRFRSNGMLRDGDGGLWIGTEDRGLVHVHQGRIDVFNRSDGLSADFIERLFEDREGNIWVATLDGLDRFRDFAVSTISLKQGLSHAAVQSVLVARDGSVWLGTLDGLNRWNNGHVTVYRRADGLPDDAIESLFQDFRDRIWVSTHGGVAFFENGRFTQVSSVPGGVEAIAGDDKGNIWLSQMQSLFHVQGGAVVAQFPWAALGQKELARSLAVDPSEGGLWLAFPGSVIYLKGGQIRTSYTVADGLGKGHIRDLQRDREGTLWAATETGASRLKDGRVATLTSGNGLPCDDADWVMEDDDQSVWVYMACGLVRIDRSDLDAWAVAVTKDASARVKATVFDSSDGVRTHSGTTGNSPSVAKSADGKLWFLPWDGVSVLDPRRLPVNQVAPPVHIEQITADGKTYAATAAHGRIELPALTRELQIDYTALSFVVPEKVRFRYKLEGLDTEWHDAGTRRQAFYNALPPRSYRFRVMAGNNSGVWNETGAFVDFSVAPAYYQTTWFAALSMTALIALLWGGHRMRLRIVEKHKIEISALNERLMKAQEQERIRIAGELHDGVMQEMLAATMMLGTAKRRVPADSGATATIDKVQQKLIQAGTDLRQLSHDLHPPLLQDAGLPRAVHAYCEQFSTTWGIPVSCNADANSRDLSRGAALAVFRILQEALGNAAKHAAAGRITVRLIRSRSVVSLTVSDDGGGFDRSRLASGGGLGLVMMRERASQLNGTFEFDSAPGRGTTITVTIPFR